ncbi:MAG: hypothetical protein R6V50_07050 [Thermoplasmatota archaeon]
MINKRRIRIRSKINIIGNNISRIIIATIPAECCVFWDLSRTILWSWKLVNNLNGGSIAAIGFTGLCWYSAEYEGAGSNWLSLQFFKEYDSGEKVIGKIWIECITKFVSENPIDWNAPSGSGSCIDAKTVQEWALLGDPSLIIGETS